MQVHHLPQAFILALTLSLGAQATAQADDAYVKLLEQEANKAQIDPATDIEKTRQEQELTLLHKVSPERIPQGLERLPFQIYLMDNQYDLYSDYIELGQAQKDLVYQLYSNMKRPNRKLLSKVIRNVKH